MSNLHAPNLLNGLTPAQFLADYWQKKPLLIRQAIPNFKGLLSPNDLAGLACDEEVQARIISQKNNTWQVKHGPFEDADFAKLGKKNCTLLVQSVNQYLPEAADLLAQFNFIPHARLDDLMVSYAPTGGGVGAHMDSYDVFLLQGSGKRNWKISAQTELSLVENAPLRILKHFKPEQEWVLEAGDMLYLPPQIAHWGVSESDDCMTYSIGFRAPKTQELQHEFLNYLQDHIQADGLYSDPDLCLQNHPAEISDDMISKVAEMLEKMTWDKQHVADFLGKYLSEPKVDVVFAPNKKISKNELNKHLATKTLWLSLKSQLLFAHDHFYLNGEKLIVPDIIYNEIKYLADNKHLNTNALEANIHAACGDALYDAYLAGYVCFKR
jgi:50S ribosomal protein L16 3-hydroxylase